MNRKLVTDLFVQGILGSGFALKVQQKQRQKHFNRQTPQVESWNNFNREGLSEIQKNRSNNLKQADPSGGGVDPVSLEVLRRRQKFSKQGLARFLTRMEERIMFQAKYLILIIFVTRNFLIICSTWIILIIFVTRIYLILIILPTRIILIIFFYEICVDYIFDKNNFGLYLWHFQATWKLHLKDPSGPSAATNNWKVGVTALKS